MTFVLNALDALAGDDRFIDIRKRRPQHRVLSRIEDRMDVAREDSIQQRKKFNEDFDSAISKVEQDFKDRVDTIEKKTDLDRLSKEQQKAMAQMQGTMEVERQRNKLKTDRDKKIHKIDADLAQQVQSVQDWYKLWAVVLPPIPPLLVGLAVYFNRRAKEREGVARSRLKA